MTFLVLCWIIIGGFVGLAIGRTKGRPDAGFFFGAFLGVLGWLLIALGPDARPKCPRCLGAVPERAELCQHCGSQLRVPYPPGFPK